uniref:Uncharacterized protein n=1 Tax=Anguilla anguilla TaxID=7936 RepID=A0A0E9V6D6_ANGAN
MHKGQLKDCRFKVLNFFFCYLKA